MLYRARYLFPNIRSLISISHSLWLPTLVVAAPHTPVGEAHLAHALWIVDGQDALFQVVALLLAAVQAEDAVAQIGQASTGDQFHVANANGTNAFSY